MTTYTTNLDAIEAIATAIEAGGTDTAHRDEYDLDAIFRATHEYDAEAGGFVQTVDEDGFWAAVQRQAKDVFVVVTDVEDIDDSGHTAAYVIPGSLGAAWPDPSEVSLGAVRIPANDDPDEWARGAADALSGEGWTVVGDWTGSGARTAARVVRA
ncbi:hypothetical protein [Phytoactinopolyspora limicola]|uniref:hypothetical protein n=1 Tax=Phytoactinopolyspora limicola TaxID=2715536 RepID=UPI001409A961|nr:hypothetical protein [Phytoactinopolyspora limicola]